LTQRLTPESSAGPQTDRTDRFLAGGLAACVVLMVLAWNFTGAFQGDILGFYKIGTILPHSPFLHPNKAVLAQGEVGYDGQMFLSIALDPSLSQPQSLASLDNPRYRCRRILFPLLGYLTSFGWRPAIPFMLVAINAACFIALVVVVAGFLSARGRPAREALFILAIPGLWCSLLLTTADLLASLLLALALIAFTRKRYKSLALFYGLAALTHETMIAVVGSLAIPLLFDRHLRNAGTVLLGCVPAAAWNIAILLRLPSTGSTTGIAENFSTPGRGIIEKFQAIFAGPMSAKWLFDSSTFFLLCATLCLLILSALSRRTSGFAVPCSCVYLGFFLLAKMQILSYYLNFLRVFASVLLLLVVSLEDPLWPTARNTVMPAWAAVSVAFVGAYSLGLI